MATKFDLLQSIAAAAVKLQMHPRLDRAMTQELAKIDDDLYSILADLNDDDLED